MKKFLSTLLVLLSLALLLSSCATEKLSIEDYEWQMRTVMSGDVDTVQNKESLIVAVGEPDDLYPNAKIVDITLIAKNGTITLVDSTNNKTYSGTYTVQKKTPHGTDYEIAIDGINGYATVAPTKYYDDSEVPSLPINLGECALYFIPQK